jgi:hypothetical protein
MYSLTLINKTLAFLMFIAPIVFGVKVNIFSPLLALSFIFFTASFFFVFVI